MRGRKADLYDGGLRVPCMIRYPNHITPGTVTDEPAQGYDILPTLCGLLNIAVPNDRAIDGINLVPIFDKQPLDRKDPLFWAFETRPGDAPQGYEYAVRSGKWKLISDKTVEKTLLYNLETDPYETRELSEKHPAIVQRLTTFIKMKKEQIQKDLLRPRSSIE